jgi:competence protein ComEA
MGRRVTDWAVSYGKVPPSGHPLHFMTAMPTTDPSHALLPERFQPLIAGGLGLGLVAMAGWFVAAGGLTGGLVDHDAAPAGRPGFSVNINAAGAIELAQLPGLGPVTAERIVDYRREHGPFVSHDELLAVPGIGPVTLESLRPFLRPIRQRREAP